MALSAKQKRFINEYLIDGNATRAAERAGYKGDDNTLAVTGHDNLRNPKIAEVISRRTQESAMGAEEVLRRLADHARGSMGDFVKVNERGQPQFDFESAQKFGKLHLVKKLKTKTRIIDLGKPDEEAANVGDGANQKGLITEVTVEFELHDAQAALVQIGKHHGLFSEKVDINHSGEIVTKIIEGPKDVR